MKSRGGTSRGTHDFFSGGSNSRRDPTISSRIKSRDDETHSSPKLATRMSGLQLLTRPSQDEDRSSTSPRMKETEGGSAPTSRGRGRGGFVIARPAIPARRQIGSTSVPESQLSPKTDASASMNGARKLIGESMTFEDFIGEYLTDNTNFTVIGAIGPQGCGKSTILSMLGGNDPHDLYRHYVFRPASREAIESSRYQTVKIYAYVSKSRTILLDCQASNCASMLEESLRHSRSSKIMDRLDVSTHVEGVELMAFLLQVCQTVLLCCDWALDLELFKLIRTAESIRATLDHVPTDISSIDRSRKVNLVFLHTKAKSADFSSTVRKQTARIIRAIFADSRRIRISDDDDAVVVPLADLKPRKDNLTGMHAPVLQERMLDTQSVVDFEKGVKNLRLMLACLPQDSFSQQTFTEKNWLSLARFVWKDPSFQSSVDRYGGFV